MPSIFPVCDSSRSKQKNALGREYYAALKAGGAMAAVPPDLPPVRSTPRSAPLRQLAAPVEASAEAPGGGGVGGATSLLEPHLVSLAARLGSTRGLPELHVFVQETVNETLRGLRDIVQSHVDNVLRADKMTVVQDMVRRLLTEEVLRVAADGARALKQQELAEIELNQQRLFTTLEEDAEAWRRQFQEVWEVQRALDASGRSVAVVCKDLQTRLAKAESNFEFVSQTEQRLVAAALEIKAVGKETCVLHEASRLNEVKLADLEKRCEQRYVTDRMLADWKAEILRSVRQLDDAVEGRREVALQTFVSHDKLQERLAATQTAVEALVEREKTALNNEITRNWQFAGETRTAMNQQYATKIMLEEALGTAAEKREAIRKEMERWVAKLDETATVVGVLEAEIGSAGAAREALAQQFQASFTEVDAFNAETRGKVNDLGKLVKTHHHEFQLASETSSFARDRVSKLGDQYARLSEEFSNERTRAANIAAQQQHNRLELNYLNNKVGTIDPLAESMKAQQATIEDQTKSISNLKDEVGQWANAIAAQQELRRLTAQLRADIDAVQANIVKLEGEQRLATVDMRRLHSVWLQAPPAADKAATAESPREGVGTGGHA